MFCVAVNRLYPTCHVTFRATTTTHTHVKYLCAENKAFVFTSDRYSGLKQATRCKTGKAVRRFRRSVNSDAAATRQDTLMTVVRSAYQRRSSSIREAPDKAMTSARVYPGGLSRRPGRHINVSWPAAASPPHGGEAIIAPNSGVVRH